MIISKRAVVSTPLSKFGLRRGLTSGIATPAFNLTLENTSAKYVFNFSNLKGVVLSTITYKSTGTTFTNVAKNLWRIGVISDIETSPHLENYTESYKVICPSNSDFSYTQTTGSSSQTLTLVWTNIKYDKEYPNKKLKVTLTCVLEDDAPDISFALKLTHVPGSPIADLDDGVIVAAVGYPELALRKDEDTQEEDVLAIGSLFGETIRNPIKNFTSPRFESESVARAQYLQDDETETYRFYKNGEGQGASPLGSIQIYNHGSPGYMSIPLLVFGNRTTKDGIMYYAYDPEGIHAKNFQCHTNGDTIHFKCWDLSDSEMDAYGVGGKWVSTNTYNTTNELGWKLKLRPFHSPTKWVDWYACKLYKTHVVPDLEEFGWVPNSFYDRYLEGSLAARDVENPFYMSTIGHLSGNADDIFDALDYYRTIYSGFSLAGTPPPIHPHVQEVVYNINIHKNESYQYYGWTTFGTGNSGIATYKSPDLYINSVFSGSIYTGAVNDECHGMMYNAFSPRVSPYSDHILSTMTNIDVISKSKATSLKIYLTGDFNDYVSNNTTTNAFFSQDWRACIGIEANRTKFKETILGLAQVGAGSYHDTFGHWGGFGCYADYHSYLIDGDAPAVGVPEHPKSMFSYYFNNVQRELLSGYTDIFTNSGLSDSKQYMAQSCEFVSDAQLKYIPCAINQSNNTNVELKTIIRYLTEPQRTDIFYEAELIPGFVTAALRRPDTWKLSLPMMNIIYGDRLVYADFLQPVLSNSLDVSGSYISVSATSGYNDSGVLEVYTATHEERVQQLRHIVSNQFSEFNRLTLYHGSLDIKDWDATARRLGTNTTWADLTTENHATIMESTQWSGYFDYVKELIKLQAFEPDYIFHGRTEYPLDDYASPWCSGSFVTHGFRDSNRSLSEPTGMLDEGVHHTVKRNVSSSNLLIWFTNWTNTDQNFTGYFDPLTYEYGSAYDLYSLELSGTSAGTKTLLGTYSLDTVYEFDLTVPSGSTLAYEISPATTLRETSTFDEFSVAYSNVRYSYSNQTLTTNGLTIGYSYDSECDATVTGEVTAYKAASTQAIVNNLPQWMKMRQDVDSDGWKLVNSWGMALESVIEYADEAMSNMFLETANLSSRSSVGYLDITDEEVFKPRDSRNILFNSSFTIKDVARSKKPAGWTTYNKGTVEYADNQTLVGLPVKMTGGCLSQTVELSERIDYLTASVYIKAPNASPQVKLILTIEKIDGTIISTQGQITSRSSEWKRLVVPVEINEEVYRARLTVINNSSVSYVAIPQLERGNKVTDWTRSDGDSLPWIRSISTDLNIIQAISSDGTNTIIPIYPIGNEQEFVSIEVPTRIKKIPTPIKTSTLVSSQVHSRKVSFFNEIFPEQWVASEGEIQERSFYPTTYDIFGRYDIKELRVNEYLQYGTRDCCDLTITPLATCIRERLLFVVCSEITESQNIHTLKIIQPKTPPGSQTYLESIQDFILDLGSDDTFDFNQLSETITSIGFLEDDPSILFINTTSNRRFYYRIYFDYYFFNPTNGRVYTVEKYDGARFKIT